MKSNKTLKKIYRDLAKDAETETLMMIYDAINDELISREKKELEKK